ncbi:MAG: hypothetical protein GKR94_12520 [Gammaproteobacteria bacterium]|nr:hypothetical protein [Gammaproteobacteria bacterium]
MSARHTLLRRPGPPGADWAVLPPGVPRWRLGALDTLLTPGEAVVLLAPSPDVRLMEAAMPGMSQRQARQAIPFSLEDGFAEDLDALQLAVGGRTVTSTYSVTAVAKRRLAGWLHAVSNAGARVVAVIPELLTLPWAEGQLSLSEEDGRVHIRWGACRGLSVEHALLDPALAAILAEHAPQRVCVYGAALSAPISRLDGLETVVTTAHGSDFSGIAARMAHQTTAVDIRGEEQRAGIVSLRALTPWRGTLLAAGVATLLGFAQLWSDIAALEAERGRWDGLARAAYRQAFPEDGPAIDVERLLRRRLASLGGTGAGRGGTGGTGGAQAAGVIDLLHAVARAQTLSSGKDTTVQELRYRDGALDVVLMSDELATLEAWRARLAEVGGALRGETLSAVATPDGARATVQVRGR